MSASHRKPAFLREAVFGLIVSVAAASLAAALGFVLRPDDVLRVVVAGLALAGLLRTFGTANEKIGRIAVVALWAVATLMVWFWYPSAAVYVLVQLAIVWLVRSLYLHSHFIEAVLDLALSALAISFGVWAGLRTESLLLAIWSYSLIQALHVSVPGLAARWLEAGPAAAGDEPGNRNFADAFAAGEEALRRIAARQ